VGGVFLNGTVAPGVIEHELGHNLGLLHAGAYGCAAASMSAGCLVDYGDPTDVMGDPTADHGYSAEHKYQLGWIPASEVRTVTTGTQTIALTAAEHPLVAGSTELIRVRAADGTLFAIDRRASVGFDVGLSGVWIRDVAKAGTDDTELMRSTALTAGETFTDAVHRITIKTVDDRASTASVEVCVGPCVVPIATQTAPAPRSITARNIATATKRSSRNTSIELTVPAGRTVLAGRTVIVTTDTTNTAGAVACTDSRGDVYKSDVNSVGARRLIICSAHANATLEPGATITVHYPSFDGAALSTANQFSGLEPSALPDRTSVAHHFSVAINSGTTPPTRRRAELVFGVVVYDGTPTYRAGTGDTHIGDVAVLAGTARLTIVAEFKIVSAVGAFTVTGTLSSPQPWRAAIVTFVAA
jgi:hypothetical protein